MEWSTLNDHYLTIAELEDPNFIAKIYKETKSSQIDSNLSKEAVAAYLSAQGSAPAVPPE